MPESPQFPEEQSGWVLAQAEGRSTVEAEHRVEMALLGALEDAVRRDLGPNRINEILTQLIEHTTVHFMSEQMLMRLTAYPGYEAHALEHDQLLEQAQALQDRVDAGHSRPTLAFIESVRTWLTKHIEGQDRSFLSHLEGAGPSQ
jgi:hemerythrin-like metal-binding protein